MATGEQDPTITSAVIGAVATVAAALIAAAVALYNKRSKPNADVDDENDHVRRQRLDERDHISAEGGVLIPVETDHLWSEYYALLESSNPRDKNRRRDASKTVMAKASSLPNESIKTPLKRL